MVEGYLWLELSSYTTDNVVQITIPASRLPKFVESVKTNKRRFCSKAGSLVIGEIKKLRFSGVLYKGETWNAKILDWDR